MASSAPTALASSLASKMAALIKKAITEVSGNLKEFLQTGVGSEAAFLEWMGSDGTALLYRNFEELVSLVPRESRM